MHILQASQMERLSQCQEEDDSYDGSPTGLKGDPMMMISVV